MEGASCLDLALEGERLCKAGDCRTGAEFFEAALQVGTDDLQTLSAIYSQLGNAYFYLQDYGRALEYHRHDLNLTRTLGDQLGEAKASGNLGNTLKVLGKFEEAIACCNRHLAISRDLEDRVGEARALYNLGNVYHAQAKQARNEPGECPPEVATSLNKAVEYYLANLKLVGELSDRAAQGRACGNLGNTYYLLGSFHDAIHHHKERLSIAKEFGDKAAERRAYSNLGNAHIFLGEFETAAEYYLKTLELARCLGDRALEAQACYSLGNTYTLLHNFSAAIDYHRRHMQIAVELRDKVGESRACWSLANAFSALQRPQQALTFANRHLELSKETCDEAGVQTAQTTISDLQASLNGRESTADGLERDTSYQSTPSVSTDPDSSRLEPRQRRRSMEQLELMKLTPDKREKLEGQGGARSKAPLKLTNNVDDSHAHPRTNGAYPAPAPLQRKDNNKKDKDEKKKEKDKDDSISPEGFEDEGFFELLHRFQSRRLDEQRCSFRMLNSASGGARASAPQLPVSPPRAPAQQEPTEMSSSPAGPDQLMDLLARSQSKRLNDQRASGPRFPGLRGDEGVLGQLLTSDRQGGDGGPEDTFFDMIMRSQGSRIEEQRSQLPAPPPARPAAPTVPDDDFFSLIQRFQSSRLDEQRSALPQGKENVTKSLFPNSHKKKKK